MSGLYALVNDGQVVAVAADAAMLGAFGAGSVVAVPPEAEDAARTGAPLVLDDGAPAEALSYARAQLWEQVLARREAAERGGCATPKGRVDTDLESMVRINGAVSAALAAAAGGVSIIITWTMEDNSAVVHLGSDLLAMGQAVLDHADACHARARVLRQAIADATDAQALAAIDIDSGWPGGGE